MPPYPSTTATDTDVDSIESITKSPLMKPDADLGATIRDGGVHFAGLGARGIVGRGRGPWWGRAELSPAGQRRSGIASRARSWIGRGIALHVPARWRRAVFPDPSSRFQPEGVHGPSEVVDPRRSTGRTTPGADCAIDDLVIYELHVGTFTPEGTFDGAHRPAARRCRELGVTAIELMPVAEFPGRAQLGLRRRRPLRAVARLRRARGSARASSTPRTRTASASSSTSSTTTSDPTATTCGVQRRTTSPTATTRRGATPSTTTDANSRSVRELRASQNASLLAARVPRRRPAARRHPRHRRRQPDAPPGRARRSRASGGRRRGRSC